VRAILAAVRSLIVLSLFLTAAPAARAELEPVDGGLMAPAAEGLWLGATLEGAYLARDLWAGAALGLGYEHRAFGLHLRAPLYLSVWDLEPAREDRYPLCGAVRCAEWIDDDGGLRAESLSRLVSHLRLGRPGGWLHLEGGPVFATLGSGRLVDRYLNSPEHDRRQSGVYGKVQAPFAGLSAELVVGNLFVPHKMSGARVSVRPLAPLFAPQTLFGPLLSRLRLAAEAAADLVAPSTSGARPLGAGALELAWPLLEEGGLFSLTPFGSAGFSHGLTPDGGAPSAAPLGGGASAGGRIELRLPFVGLRFDGDAFVDGPGHRTGLFTTLYEVERTRALAGASDEGGGLLSVPAPGGLGWRASVELALLDVLLAGARYKDDTAPGGDTLEAWAFLSLFGAQLGLRAIRRDAPSSAPAELLVLDERTLVVAEGSARVFGPVSVFARWFRTPRHDGKALRVDDDVFVGVSGDLVLGFGAPDRG
jgi:hypothetical protein